MNLVAPTPKTVNVIGVDSHAEENSAMRTVLDATTDMETKLSKYPNPNFTIMLPGTCNAKCKFCFWKKCEEETPLSYFTNLRDVLINLPQQYKTISISGGEPTLSSFLQDTLKLLHKLRKQRSFERIGLTTNGARLDMITSCTPYFGVLDFVNISRHHWRNAENFKEFGVKAFYDLQTLIGYSAQLRTSGVKLTLNCVIDDNTTPDFIDSYLGWMNKHGFPSVAFRKDGNSLDPTPVELFYVNRFGRAVENGCPVCRTNTQRLGEIEVMWKCGLHEPSIAAGEVTELIFQPNGKTYADWGFKFEVDVMKQKKAKEERSTYVHERGSCGSGGCH